jgi:hypothetical protein
MKRAIAFHALPENAKHIKDLLSQGGSISITLGPHFRMA